jgi:hypothetical protein
MAHGLSHPCFLFRMTCRSLISGSQVLHPSPEGLKSGSIQTCTISSSATSPGTMNAGGIHPSRMQLLEQNSR